MAGGWSSIGGAFDKAVRRKGLLPGDELGRQPIYGTGSHLDGDRYPVAASLVRNFLSLGAHHILPLQCPMGPVHSCPQDFLFVVAL
jgi:hypothetical protein